MQIKKVALIGMGAIGTVYGNLLYHRLGGDFTVIAGGTRADKLKRNGASLNGSIFYPAVAAPQDKTCRADLIILCVKNYQLEAAISDIRNFVDEKTVILPLLNGITARDRILLKYPHNKVLYGLAIHIDARRFSTEVTNTANGTIQFGDADNTVPAPEILSIKELLDSSGIESCICPDMVRSSWKKWMLNVGCNQVSAVTGTTYGNLIRVETNRILFHDAMMEVVALAEASCIDLTEKDVLEFEKAMSTFSPDGKTSMLQDIEAKRKTEVESFAGTVVKLGEKLHVPTPVNHILYCIIKSKEQLYPYS